LEAASDRQPASPRAERVITKEKEPGLWRDEMKRRISEYNLESSPNKKQKWVVQKSTTTKDWTDSLQSSSSPPSSLHSSSLSNYSSPLIF